MYTFHSLDFPADGQDTKNNFCWRSSDSRVFLSSQCNFFRVRTPGIKSNPSKPVSVSFESACVPGVFVRQKNYRFVLQAKSDSPVFGKACKVLSLVLEFS